LAFWRVTYELFLYGERNSLKKFLFKESFCDFHIVLMLSSKT